MMGMSVILAACVGTSPGAEIFSDDFENAGATPDDGYGTDMVLDGWSFLGGGTATGVHNPSAAQIAAEAHSGTYCAFVNGSSWGGAGPVQQVLTATYQPNTTYTLTAYVAYRNDLSDHPVDAELQLWDVDHATHFSVASSVLDITAAGEWQLITAGFTTGTTDDCLGDHIAVRFNLINSDGQLLIDDVTLTPEPATMCLLGVGGLGMLLRRKR
ncbi:MAG: carbohydrate binding domain-containing protein [Phycisphaerae bacterium]|nr:carbohydrate binding domain-containing protein [Phycisphaerae bacterium]